MSGHVFQFAVLRYVHDPLTQEFLNIGVVVYSRSERFFRAALSTRYGRLSEAFPGIDGAHYRRVVDYLGRRIDQVCSSLAPRVFEELPAQIELMLARVLPEDDAALVFGGFGGGLTDDLDAELGRLFDRLVTRYLKAEDLPSRNDQEVWQVFRRELEERRIISRLQPVTLGTRRYRYPFKHAWKNEKWNPIEPVSLDLMHGSSILEKANQWIGRTVMLRDSDNIGTMFLLLGSPGRPDVQDAYETAVQNLQEKVPPPKQIFEEHEAPAFSGRLAEIIAAHD